MPEKEETKVRVSWDEYYMKIAFAASERSTCPRKHVGSVIVHPENHSILATGYNGSIRGTAHCDSEGCLMENGHCVRTIHSEANSIVQAAKNGIRIDGASIYVTALPCLACFNLIANSGIKQIIFSETYRDENKIAELAAKANIELKRLE